jgi:hypothetical protein
MTQNEKPPLSEPQSSVWRPVTMPSVKETHLTIGSLQQVLAYGGNEKMKPASANQLRASDARGQWATPPCVVTLGVV